MCGIAGIVEQGAIGLDAHSALGRMLNRLQHRGPDDSGTHLSSDIALGHRRLSIIDLATGRQPIANETETVWVVVNGEIYNFAALREGLIGRGHNFRTASDAECLVHLYEDHGPAFVERLNGMFALALWDASRRRLVLARDRLGVKPLYYSVAGGRLVFASELKAVLAVPNVTADIDPTAMVDYLTYGYIPSPKTIFKQCRKLEPGHLLEFQDGRHAVRRYWDLQHRGHDDRSTDEIASDVWQQLKQATRSRLVADVPVGAFLSGGLDSGAVTSAMSQMSSERIVTVTCGFREKGFDERRHARALAEKIGAEHHDGLVRPDAAGIVDTLAWHFDEPFADASAVPTYYLSQLARRFVTVALSGDGGDETMAGYRRYRFDQYEDALRRWVPGGIRRTLIGRIASAWPERPWVPRPLRAAATLRNVAVDAATAHGLSVATLHPSEAVSLLDPDFAREVRGYDPLDHIRRHFDRCDAPDLLSKCQYVDIRLGLGDGILTKVDRASMAHALEVRSPMLDYRFVESVWRIPPSRRIQGRHGKIPLRRAVLHHVGEAAANRPKAGFEVPLDAWFRGPLRERVSDRLMHLGAASHTCLSLREIGAVWRRHLSDRRDCGPTLWKLMMFDAWCERIASLVRQPSRETPREVPRRGQGAAACIPC